MSTKTILQQTDNRFYESGETAAQYNVGVLVSKSGDTITALASDDANPMLLIMTAEGHPDKGCYDWDDSKGLIDSGDSVKCVRLQKGMKVNLWLDDSDNAANDVSEGDDLYLYGSTGDAGTVSGIGTNNALFAAAEDVDNQAGDNPVRIKAYVK